VTFPPFWVLNGVDDVARVRLLTLWFVVTLLQLRIRAERRSTRAATTAAF